MEVATNPPIMQGAKAYAYGFVVVIPKTLMEEHCNDVILKLGIHKNIGYFVVKTVNKEFNELLELRDKIYDDLGSGFLLDLPGALQRGCYNVSPAKMAMVFNRRYYAGCVYALPDNNYYTVFIGLSIIKLHITINGLMNVFQFYDFETAITEIRYCKESLMDNITGNYILEDGNVVVSIDKATSINKNQFINVTLYGEMFVVITLSDNDLPSELVQIHKDKATKVMELAKGIHIETEYRKKILRARGSAKEPKVYTRFDGFASEHRRRDYVPISIRISFGGDYTDMYYECAYTKIASFKRLITDFLDGKDVKEALRQSRSVKSAAKVVSSN